MVKLKKHFVAFVLFLPVYLFSACDKSEQDFEKAKKEGTAEAYDTFISNHPKSDIVDEARDSIVAVFDRETDLNLVINDVFGIIDYEAASRVRNNVEHRVEILYAHALAENSIEGWNAYIDAVPESYQKDAREKLLDLQWQNEAIAWQITTEKDNAIYYKKYLEHHPKGKHAKQAERRLIDLEVSAVFAGEHGILPSMDRGYSTGASYSVIEIENRTQYDLTVSYSGPDSKRMVIHPYGTRSMRIGNGSYRVAANVGHGVIPFAGTEYLDGSYFSSAFYISTVRSGY